MALTGKIFGETGYCGSMKKKASNWKNFKPLRQIWQNFSIITNLEQRKLAKVRSL